MRRALLSLVGLVLAGCDASSPTRHVGPQSSKTAFATVVRIAACPDSVAAVDIPAGVRDSEACQRINGRAEVEVPHPIFAEVQKRRNDADE